jgi:hypothetical protein
VCSPRVPEKCTEAKASGPDIDNSLSVADLAGAQAAFMYNVQSEHNSISGLRVGLWGVKEGGSREGGKISHRTELVFLTKGSRRVYRG